MTAAIQLNPERRQHAKQLIDELKKERHEVWALYCHIAELKPFSASQKVTRLLTEFSQLLIDYISLGHFGIYERLLSGTERRSAVLSLAQEIYPELSRTTDAAIAFNDKYAHIQSPAADGALLQDLSTLGENLALRIDLEDRLCAMLLC
ncbi:MAG: Rsd/AlgQ family anti-sigma factor [Gammaproteobacteria bacterium]